MARLAQLLQTSQALKFRQTSWSECWSNLSYFGGAKEQQWDTASDRAPELQQQSRVNISLSIMRQSLRKDKKTHWGWLAGWHSIACDCRVSRLSNLLRAATQPMSPNSQISLLILRQYLICWCRVFEPRRETVKTACVCLVILLSCKASICLSSCNSFCSLEMQICYLCCQYELRHWCALKMAALCAYSYAAAAENQNAICTHSCWSVMNRRRVHILVIM